MEITTNSPLLNIKSSRLRTWFGEVNEDRSWLTIQLDLFRVTEIELTFAIGRMFRKENAVWTVDSNGIRPIVQCPIDVHCLWHIQSL